MTKLGSVNLTVKDIAAAEKFYTEILGLRPDEERSNRPSFVLLRSANCFLTLQDAGAMGRNPRPGDAVELGFEVEDVGAVRQKLGDRAAVQQMGWGDAVEAADPDGNKLNLYRLA